LTPLTALICQNTVSDVQRLKSKVEG